jgi:hypothetical protein
VSPFGPGVETYFIIVVGVPFITLSVIVALVSGDELITLFKYVILLFAWPRSFLSELIVV